MTPLEALQTWYTTHCNGHWEHTYGVTISTLDNPGWAIDIDLAGTPLQDATFEHTKAHRTEHDWLECWTADHKFHGRGGPNNLSEMIDLFINWTKWPKA